MAATGFLNACGFTTTSGGTGSFVVSAPITGYHSPAQLSAVDGTVFSYRAESSDKTQWEVGFGTYTVATTTLTRTLVDGSGGSPVNFTNPPNVYITALYQDLQNAALLTSGTLPVARLNGGNANQLVQGDGSYQTLGRKLLNTLTASNSTSLLDTTSLTSTFDSYEIVWENLVPATSGVALELQVHSGGAYQNTSYLGQEGHFTGTGFASSSVAGYIPLSAGTNVTTTIANVGASGSIRVKNPSQTSAPKPWWGQYLHGFTGPAVVLGNCGGIWNGGNGAIDGFELLFSSGNISSGTVKVYGLS